MMASNVTFIFDHDTIPKTTWIISALAGELLLSLYMHYQQYSHIHSIHQVPRILQEYGDGIYTSVDLDMSREYCSNKLIHSAWKKLYIMTLWMITIHLDGIYLIWKTSSVTSLLWPGSIDPVISRNASFALILFVANEILTFPVVLSRLNLTEKYGQFKEESARGRAAEWVQLYLRDLVMNMIPIVGVAGFLGWILKVLDSKSIQIQMVIIISFIYVFILIYPSFDIWWQLKEHRNSSRSFKSPQLKRLCALVGFPRKHLLLLQRGHTASHDNAFYYGFLWFRRIVVFHDLSHHHDHDAEDSSTDIPYASDTILTNGEIEAIVAHELGHWKYGHSNKDLLTWHAMHISSIILAFAIRSEKLNFEGIFQYFGLPLNEKDLSEGILILPGIFIAYILITRFYFYVFECLYQARQHSFEKQADKFATGLHYSYGKDLGKALIKISIMSKSFPSQDPSYSLFYHSHPSLVTRLQLISKCGDDCEHHRSRPYRISRRKR